MKLQESHKWVLLCGMLCVAMSAQVAAQKAASTAAIANATVVDFKGKVLIELPGQGPSVLSSGQVLPAETVVTTGNGRLLLKLEDGSQILVHPNTRLVLKQPSPASWWRMEVFLGKIKAEIQKRLGGSPPFQIGTPSAVISVRGTRFYVKVSKHRMTRVAVEEGEVWLENARGIGHPVLLKSGFSSDVTEDSAPGQPKATPGSQRQSDGNGRDNGASGPGQHGNSPGSNMPPGSRGGGRRP
jgi:ferric-dicitrate binding protein FerR (iron transport regulator)